MRERIDRYLLRVLQSEIDFLSARIAATDNTTNRISSFYSQRLKELYWTIGHALQGNPVTRSWRAFLTRRDYGGESQTEHAPEAEPDVDGKWRPAPSVASQPQAGTARILIDTTPLHRDGGRTGIQRVVREMARAATQSGDALPVFISRGRLHRYREAPELSEEVPICADDIFLMPDASWNHQHEYPAIMQQVSDAGGTNIVLLYDIVPVRYPAAFREVSDIFAAWIENVALRADAIMAISKSTAEDFLAYARSNRSRVKAGMRVGWWHLGADFHADGDQTASAEALLIGEAAAPFFLSVGTLEPRKGYPIALAAFETLWREGIDVRYVIVGGRGWNYRALEAQITGSPEFGKRLFWLERGTDGDIRYLYAHARMLIAASFVEGFGLPIVEAAYHGLPAIASDIPVFHEIGNEDTTYFTPLDSDSLADRIRDTLASPRRACTSTTRSWKEATAMLMVHLRTEDYQFSVDERPEGNSAIHGFSGRQGSPDIVDVRQ